VSEAVVGLVGVVIGLLGAFLLHWRQGREARDAKTRDLRIESYSDAMRHIQRMVTRIDWLVEEAPFRSKRMFRDDLSALDDVTGRLRLVAPDSVWQAWSEVLVVQDLLSWNYTEVYAVQSDGQPGADESDADVTRARAAYAAFVAAAKSDVGF
jgi:hypothetical protein